MMTWTIDPITRLENLHLLLTCTAERLKETEQRHRDREFLDLVAASEERTR